MNLRWIRDAGCVAIHDVHHIHHRLHLSLVMIAQRQFIDVTFHLDVQTVGHGARQVHADGKFIAVDDAAASQIRIELVAYGVYLVTVLVQHTFLDDDYTVGVASEVDHVCAEVIRVL